VPFGALPLARERSHLALYLTNHIVEPREIERRLLEAAFRAAASVAIQTDTGGFLEQLPALVGTVREKRVDHPALDHHARVGAEAGAAHQVLDVTESARRSIEQILALPRAREPARDHDFAERHGKHAVVVVEVQRDFRDVHRPPPRRSLEDDLFHLRAAQRTRALLAEHPAHRIGDVRLAAAVRTDDRGHARLEDHLGPVGERLEPV